MAKLDEYLWIAVLGALLGFLYGFLIGANDVANAFASSVASKSITLGQAVIIASIFEFSGAFFLGAAVTGTIRSKIVSTDLYVDEPEILMLGMFTSLAAANLMLFIATHLGMPVSTTHDIVGCIMGFSIAAKGFDSVQWDEAKNIFISWFASPLIAGAVGAVLFGSVKWGIMKSPQPYERVYWFFPLVLTIGLGIDIFYVLYKASSNFSGFKEDLSLSWVLPTSFGAGAFVGVLWLVIFGPIARKRVMKMKEDRENAALVAAKKEEVENGSSDDPTEDQIHVDQVDGTVTKTRTTHSDVPAGDARAAPVAEQPQAVGAMAKFQKMYGNFADNTYRQDLEGQSMSENAHAAVIWEQGERFDVDAENLFTYIQVFTACLNSFAHGANDVSNTIAPLSAILQIYRDGTVESKSKVQKWVLAYGGIAIVVGLLLYGYRVMKSIGYKLTILSPSRGASAELAASLTVVTASFLELPVSSTQCIVGAVAGVAVVGGSANLHWLFLLRVCCSWVGLFFTAVILSAGTFALFGFSPSVND